MGRHITDFIPDSGIPAVIASGEPELGAWRSIQGSERKILVNRIPLRDQDGHVIGAFSLTLFDTPEQMQALLQRVDFLDKKVNSYARRIKSASGQAIPSIPSSATAPPSRVQVLPAALRATESPVLILGATGTGKELAASAIHMASNRPDGPFVSINCAAIPKELFESEVFGYVPGAFSGAHKDGKIGRSNWPIRAPCSSTKWGIFPCTHRSSCSGCWRRKPSPGSDRRSPGPWISGLSPRPTATSKK